MNKQARAMTGVVRPEPLRELNGLLCLGAEIVDVVRWDTAPRWGLVFDVDSTRSIPMNSRDLRNPTSLNRCAWQWGRSFELPPLTKADCRRVLRLMHEHAEFKNQSEENAR